MGEVIDRRQRAEQVVAFFEERIADLKRRSEHAPGKRKPRCFVGGIAFKGPHGFQSTEPGYPPFFFVRANNVAAVEVAGGKSPRQSNVAKEKIVQWDPQMLFVDLSTLQMGGRAGAVFELKTDPAYAALSAVREGRVYGLLPYNWYTRNFGSILANAYFIGKQLYPHSFEDVDPAKTADDIYRFLVGAPVFSQMRRAFDNLVFRPIPVG
jgi:iron complex transport system substrate-binding protein